PTYGKEDGQLALLLWGDLSTKSDWRSQSSRRFDLFDLKGALNRVVPELSFRKAGYPDLALAVEIWSRDRIIGFGGQLSAAKVSVMGPVLVAELHADLLLDAREPAKKFREIERFPAVRRDIAMIVPEKISHEEIERVIRSAQEPLLESVELSDLFESCDFGSAQKSLAYSLTYRDKISTLTTEQLTALQAKIRERL